MSARRQARGQARSADTAGTQVPRALLVGRCVEVWADAASTAAASEFVDYLGAWARFTWARNGWFATQGITSSAERCALVPGGAPWSINAAAPDIARNRLHRAGCTTRSLPALREEAAELYDLARPYRKALA